MPICIYPDTKSAPTKESSRVPERLNSRPMDSAVSVSHCLVTPRPIYPSMTSTNRRQEIPDHVQRWNDCLRTGIF